MTFTAQNLLHCPQLVKAIPLNLLLLLQVESMGANVLASASREQVKLTPLSEAHLASVCPIKESSQ
jgi:hypothetical protein